MITVKEVETKAERKAFFAFPIQLYKGNRYVVPPLMADEDDEFNPDVNDAYSYAESKMFLAFSDGRVVGRVAGILSHAYNKKQNVKQLRFSRLDVVDDLEVTRALIATLSDWAKSVGMNELIGPIGFSDLDKQGMLVEGFEEDDMYLTIYNYPYYVRHMEELGFKKAVDWVEYQITVPEKADERLLRLADRVQQRFGYEYVPVKGYKSVEPIIKVALKEVMNEVFAHLYGVVEITDKQIEREAKMLKQVWVDDFVTAVRSREGEIIGYGFMAPSVNSAMRAFNGKLNLKGVFRLIRDLSHPKVVDLYSIGVKKKYQNTGVNVMIMARSMKALVKRKVKYLETGPELENNLAIQAQWKDFETRKHKRRRCWSLMLDGAGENAISDAAVAEAAATVTE